MVSSHDDLSIGFNVLHTKTSYRRQTISSGLPHRFNNQPSFSLPMSFNKSFNKLGSAKATASISTAKGDSVSANPTRSESECDRGHKQLINILGQFEPQQDNKQWTSIEATTVSDQDLFANDDESDDDGEEDDEEDDGDVIENEKLPLKDEPIIRNEPKQILDNKPESSKLAADLKPRVNVSNENEDSAERDGSAIPSAAKADVESITKGLDNIQVGPEDKSKRPTKQSSPKKTLTKFDFQRFLKQLRSKDCEPVLKYIKSFLTQFQARTWSVDEQIKLVKEFQQFIFGKLIECKPFDKLSTDEDVNNTMEGLEKFIMSRIYNDTFPPLMVEKKLSPSHKEDLSKDKIYHLNLKKYRWIQPKHLDIHLKIDSETSFVKLAGTELSKVNDYKSPRDKIICILNCCKVIFALIRQQQKIHKVEENADIFVPLLVFVILKCKTRNLISNLSFVERFRNERFLVGESSYYVSSLQIAANFITTIEQSLLTISAEDFAAEIENNERKLKEDSIRRKREQKLLEEKKAQDDAQKQGLFSPLTEMIAGTGKGEDFAPSQVLKNSAGMFQQSLSTLFSSPSRESSPVSSSVDELKTAKKQSLEESKKEAKIKGERETTLENLKQMFPDMDAEILLDIVIAKNSNIGDCIDACLELTD
ncbi:BA75_00201T0 [Komagataella pastoris]|uniref:BA75_00201T0 n=1 Tax=Komagataella pastoris TaxID=4922 RepID=A0A1B2J5E7_PICPA|nr:BA75_00201T0 [Komagataella pastoris]